MIPRYDMHHWGIILRTAYAKELDLDKNQTSYDGLLDGLRLSLKGYSIE